MQDCIMLSNSSEWDRTVHKKLRATSTSLYTIQCGFLGAGTRFRIKRSLRPSIPSLFTDRLIVDLRMALQTAEWISLMVIALVQFINASWHRQNISQLLSNRNAEASVIDCKSQRYLVDSPNEITFYFDVRDTNEFADWVSVAVQSKWNLAKINLSSR